MIDIKKDIRKIKKLIDVITLIIFFITTAFSLLSIYNKWSYDILSYLMLGFSILSIILYFVLRHLSNKKYLKDKNILNKIKITRKVISIINVFLSIMIAAGSLGNDSLSLGIKILISSVPVVISVAYIALQILIMMTRNFVSSFKRKKD